MDLFFFFQLDLEIKLDLTGWNAGVVFLTLNLILEITSGIPHGIAVFVSLLHIVPPDSRSTHPCNKTSIILDKIFTRQKMRNIVFILKAS